MLAVSVEKRATDADVPPPKKKAMILILRM